jgi:hypothetical protein
MTREGHLDTSVRTERQRTLPVHLAGGPLARPCRIRSRSGVLRIALREGCRELFGDCRFELGSLGMFDTWLVDLGSEAGRLAGRQDSGEQEAGAGLGAGAGQVAGRQVGRQVGRQGGRQGGRQAGVQRCILHSSTPPERHRRRVEGEARSPTRHTRVGESENSHQDRRHRAP